MNRMAKRLAVAGLAALISCSGGTTIAQGDVSGGSSGVSLTGTLQGIVGNAVTGARVGGDLKLYLMQRPTIRGPSRLITGSADPLMGEYAFTGVPVTLAASDATWKIVAIATGFQRFESEFTFEANNPNEENSFPSNYIDTVYNKIGNIFLFPTGTVAPDYNFTVLYNGKPVPNATVELDPAPSGNSAKYNVTTSGDTLFAHNGYVPSISYTTNTAGVATAKGTDMVLGGAYNVSVLPLVFTDSGGGKVQLALKTAGSIVVGFGTTSATPNNDVNQQIDMADAVTDNTGVPLYLASESNPPPNQQLFADGSLTLVFSQPVTLVNPQCFSLGVNPGEKADLSGP